MIEITRVMFCISIRGARVLVCKPPQLTLDAPDGVSTDLVLFHHDYSGSLDRVSLKSSESVVESG